MTTVRSSDNIMHGHIEELKMQLAHRDKLIANLQDQLKESNRDQRTSVDEVRGIDISNTVVEVVFFCEVLIYQRLQTVNLTSRGNMI